MFCSYTPQNYRRQNRKEYKGKRNLAQSALVCLLWLLYRPRSTHRPHMYPMPGQAWGMGVVGGCARAAGLGFRSFAHRSFAHFAQIK